MEAKKLSDRHPEPFRLSLHIRHPSIDPAEISRELQIEAAQSFAAGQPRKSRTLASTAVHTESYWVGMMTPSFAGRAASPQAHASRATMPALVASRAWWHIDESIHSAITGNLSSMLAWSCTRLVMGHRDFLRRLTAEGAQIRLVATLAPRALRGFTVSPEMSRMLGEFGITIEFELMDG
jgi:hypothetical protein